MSHNIAAATAGEVNKRVSWSRDLLLLAGIALAGVWVVSSFAQQASVDQQLAAQAEQLRTQNSTLTEQNQGYRKDIEAMASGAGAEEDARLNGYARSDEKLYLVSRPTASPVPTASPATPVAASGTTQTGPFENVRRWLADLWPR